MAKFPVFKNIRHTQPTVDIFIVYYKDITTWPPTCDECLEMNELRSSYYLSIINKAAYMTYTTVQQLPILSRDQTSNL